MRPTPARIDPGRYGPPTEDDLEQLRVVIGTKRHYLDTLPACDICPDGPMVDPVPSVTTLLRSIPAGPRLSKWRDEQIAKRALLMRDEICVATPVLDDAHLVERITSAPDEYMNYRAGEGSAVHQIIETIGAGDEPDALDRLQAGRFAASAISAASEIPGLRIVLSEYVVFSRTLGYSGTSDAVVELADGEHYGIDWKGVALDTPIATATGWTTMRDIEVGETIFGADGVPCNVIGKSGVKHRDCYRLTFDDATTIVCDDEHLWAVSQYNRTDKVIDTATLYDRRNLKSKPSVINAAPLELPRVDLPVDPYVLGAWLGDGTGRDGTIAKPDDRLWSEIRSCGYEHAPREAGSNRAKTVYGLVAELRSAGVLNNKHIPPAYLRASKAQRLALLQGLMDTDGSWNKVRRQVQFSVCDERLALDVRELVYSLGWRASLSAHLHEGFGKTVTAWHVNFTPFGMMPFRSRASTVEGDGGLPDRTRSKRRVIRKIEKVPTVATQCIMVDSSDSMFLVGEQMVPTHNSRASHGAYAKDAIQLSLYNWADYAVVRDLESGLLVRIPVPALAGAFVITIVPT